MSDIQAIFYTNNQDRFYSQSAISYIASSQLKAAIQNAATLLGASATAIAGAIAEENNDYQKHSIANDFQDATMLISINTHQGWLDAFIEGGQDTRPATFIERASSPVFVSLGPANFKMITAIRLLTQASQSDVAALGLEDYLNDYESLSNDIASSNVTVVAGLYALMIKEAQQWFIDHHAYGQDWPLLPQEFKDSLYVTYSNLGRAVMQALYLERTLGGKPYEPMPAETTGGGINHLSNAQVIGNSLGLPNYGGTTHVANASNVTSVLEVAKQDSDAGLAWRYALQNLNTVALVGRDYSAFNQNDELELFDEESGTGSITIPYLVDRVAFLYWKNRLDVEDNNDLTYSDGADQIFRDATIDRTIRIGTLVADSNKPQFSFGSKEADTVIGGNKNDHLYGMGGDDEVYGNDGNDYIEGNAGNDTLRGGDGRDVLLGGEGHDLLDGGVGGDQLKGGKGVDTYQFNGDYGIDVITDTDGEGIVTVNGNQQSSGTPLNGANTQVVSNIYRNQEQGYTYTKIGDGTSEILVISKDNDPNRIIINQWSSTDNLNITLSGEVAPAPQATLTGDFKKKINPNGDGEEDDTFEIVNGNYVDDGAEASALDLITGTGGNDVIKGLGGSDALFGGAGADYIDGGTQGDVLQGGLGADTLLGGDGDDIIYGSSDGSTNYPTSANHNPPNNNYSNPQGSGFNWTSGYHAPEYLNGVPGGFLSNIIDRNRQSGDAGNLIDGGDGNDFIAAGTGADTVTGGAGKDEIFGMDKDDVLLGGAGNDVIYGDGSASQTTVVFSNEDGNDIIDGGDGYDIVIGGGGNDIIFGGAGNDELFGDTSQQPEKTGDDYINGGTGDDVINGQNGNDTLIGGEGQDTLFGADGNDVLIGTGDGDKLYGGEGADTFYVGSTDEYSAQDKDDKILFLGGGNATVAEVNLNPALGTGGGGVALGLGNGFYINIADGIVGQDDSTITFADGSTILHSELIGTKLNQQVITGSTSGAMFGGKLDDVLIATGTLDTKMFGGMGNDALMGNDASNKISGGDGDDTLVGLDGADTLEGGAGNDQLYAFHYEETGFNLYTVAKQLSGDAGNDTLYGDGGSDYLDGGADHDVIYGYDANDTLEGGSGNDVLYGDAGDDVLNGGSGNDTLHGGDGSDTYLFGFGSGADIIDNYDSDPQSIDIDEIQLATGITTADVRLQRFGPNYSDLLIYLGNETYPQDALRVLNYLDEWSDSAVNSIKFSDGTTWDKAFVKRLVGLGSSGNDVFVGFDDRNDYVTTGDGDDIVYGLSGDDTLNGGNGDDTLDGGSGNDLLEAGGGNSPGSETYIFGKGYDHDVIRPDYDYWISNSTPDIIQFNSSLTPEEVAVGYVSSGNPYGSNGGLIFYVGGNEDTLLVEGFRLHDDPYWGPHHKINVIFSDGTVWNEDILVAKAMAGTIYDDYIVGTASSDLLIGGNGNDTIYGRGGDDTIDGGDGDDTIENVPNTGNSSIYGGSGNDSLNSGEGNDYLNGGTGNDYIFAGDGNDNILGGDGADDINSWGGDDTVDGGAGNDEIDTGSDGSDTIIFGYGSGSDTLTSFHQSNAYTDTIQLGLGITPTNILLKSLYVNDPVYGSRHDLVLYLNGTDDKLTVRAYFSSSAFQHVNIQFADGTIWGAAEIQNEIATESLSDFTFVGSGQNDNFSGESGSDTLSGLGGNDSLNGGAGNDLIEGGAGNDQLMGDDGVDTYLFGIGDGQDQIYATQLQDILTFKQGINPNDVVVTKDNNNLKFSIANSDDSVTVLAVFDDPEYFNIKEIHFYDGTIWDAAQIADSLTSIYGTSGNDTITGSLAKDKIFGLAGNDTINSLDGDDTIDGGLGADVMSGGQGNDTYVVDNASDSISELNNQGYDIVESSVTYTLASNLEQLILTGDVAINGTGNTLNNQIIGNDANNVLSGGTGADAMMGGLGNDTYIVDNTNDGVYEDEDQGTDTVQSSVTHTLYDYVENLTLTGSSTISGFGNTANNVLIGNTANNTLEGYEGNDFLDGGTGNDTMRGGIGDDIYVVNATTDSVIENASEGVDTIQTSVTLTTLANNVENLTLLGTSALNATGNTLNNVITGNSGANAINGGTGADTMIGGAGNDTYTVDNTLDVITENVSEGTDAVSSSVSYTLSANIETLTLTGTSAINGTGNASANTITGNSGNNILDGGAGADTLVGGTGNDTYIVDNTGDVITEASSAGTDLVQANVTYSIASYTNVENLTLLGTDNINATGNTANNVINGNTGNNLIDGGTGNDTMVGGLGNDTYVVNVTTDVVTEAASAGIDTIQSSVTLTTLAANVENITLTGTSALNATGNTLDNYLLGNSAVNNLSGGDGNDTLDGAAGADSMTGGAGNDVFIVDNTSDATVEASNGGNDMVRSSVTRTLATNIEYLVLTGTSAINGTGNALNNFLQGNSGVNTLSDTTGGNDIYQGLAGADTLTDTVATGNNVFDGGADNDTMTGGAGRDLFIGGLGNDTITTGTGFDVISFNKGDGQDAIVASTGADNTLSLGGNFAYSDLSLSKSGNNLILKMGATDQITLQNWYASGTTNKSVINLQVVAEAIQGFNLGSADTLRNNKIENFNFTNLVAAFDAAGATANWQLTDARLTAHLQAGSDTAAIGGDLAYQYGLNGNLTGMGVLNAQSVISNASFGQTAQTLNNPTVWQAEVVKLA